MKYSGIGGQAVLEGIMMRNGDRFAVAVRKEDGTIDVKEEKYESFLSKHKWARIPFIRGTFAFIDSLSLGMKAISFSGGEEENTKDQKEKKEGALSSAEMVISMIIGIALAIGLFMVLPAFLSGLLAPFIPNSLLLAVIEGVMRLLFFILYVTLISLVKDIKRVYMYHGSEHKCINCLEHGMPLTVENVMKSSKEHKRCGTSFLLIVMLISIILFMFIRIDNVLLKVVSRVLLIPVVAGISFEVLQFTGKFDNWFTYIVSRPGMWMQALTTKEPTEDMVEVAIQAVDHVFDWKAYLKENFDVTVEEENDDTTGSEEKSN